MLIKEIKKLQNSLLEKKAHLEMSLAEIGHKQTPDNKEEFDIPFPQHGDSSDENAREVTDWERNKATEAALKIELEQIKKTLDEIMAGRYGICQNCQNPIGKLRLRAIPASIHCISCAKLSEF